MQERIFQALKSLPPGAPFWRNAWMFTRPVFMQESGQWQDPDAFWAWVKTQPRELQTYINNAEQR